MDIKLKKSKRVISFLAWLIGTVLVLTNAFLFLSESQRYGDFMSRHVREVIDGDYQNTREFAAEMSDYLNTFLAMSVDGPINQGIAGYDDYAQEWTTAGAADEEWIDKELPAESIAVEKAAAETTVVEEAEENTAESEWGWEEEREAIRHSYFPDDADGESAKEQNRKEAQKYNENLQHNRNILYRIERDGQLLYTNEEGLKMYGEEDFSMPEGGYNYLLYFDGKQVTAVKDGKKLNIYGDGNFRTGGSGWEIPGFKNIKTDEAIAGSRICVAVAAVPGMTVNRNYSSDGGIYYNNSLTGIEENLKLDRERYIQWLCAMILGILLLAAAFLFRREKKEANQAIARVSGKVWYEVKLLFIAALLYAAVMMIVLLSDEYGGFYYREYGGFLWTAWEIIRAAGVNIEEGGVMAFLIFPGFLILWLFWNDARYNKKAWKKSLTAYVFDLFRTNGLKLPLGKRMIRRQIPVFLAQLLLSIAVAVGLGVAGYEYMIEEEWAVMAFIGGICLLLAWAAQLCYAKYNKKTVKELDLLADQIGAVHEGKLALPLRLPEDSDLKKAADDLNEIQKGMNTALEEQMKSERMKVELIANVSHDIKTPLTSIISYVELMKQEEGLPEHVKEYVAILENKSQRLKTMVQDVFEVSKAASGELPVHMEDLDLAKLVRQTLADMSEQIAASRVTVKTILPETPVMIHADGERLYRVFQNLIQNALKYSLDGSRVFLTLNSDGKTAAASVKNTSKEELAPDLDLTERFTRGDKSRSDGGSGLGLSIARSFTEACGGSFLVEIIADLFVVTVSFPETAPVPTGVSEEA